MLSKLYWIIYYSMFKPKSLTENMIKNFRIKGVRVTNIKLSKANPEDFKGLSK